jgi:outer membrane protein OmpA-like peptidoglycan-associated protein
MKNFRKQFAGLGLALVLTSPFILSSCKSKKKMVTAPAPVAAPVEAPKPSPAPAPVADTDGDGILDPNDKCPTVAGVAANNGCPEIKAPEPTFAYTNIQFEFNSAVLKTGYYEILDQVAKELRNYPNIRLTLNGHASAEGTDERNMTLSIDRATAVKTYLVNAGVKAENLSTKGFGESAPIAPNTTEAGREQNRRVEFKKN